MSNQKALVLIEDIKQSIAKGESLAPDALKVVNDLLVLAGDVAGAPNMLFAIPKAIGDLIQISTDVQALIADASAPAQG